VVARARAPRILRDVARQIALLTNPEAGRGRGRRTAAIALPRLTAAGFDVLELEGADGDEAAELA
jgi:diacylglycerol kinase (ATP)